MNVLFLICFNVLNMP